MKTYDCIGIGVGPFNLGLACLTEPIKELDILFLEQKETFDWHPGMMMEQTTLQVPFMADMVTLADPTNSYSILNYLKEEGRLYSFYIRENFLLFRKEYNLYCKWVIKRLSNVEMGKQVIHVFDTGNTKKKYAITVFCKKKKKEEVYYTNKLVLGTGTQPYMPSFCNNKKNVIHSAEYLSNKKQIQTQKSITLIGSGQSAAEIYYDLLSEIDHHQYELHWITRSSRFFPLEYSKLTLEMTSPEYVDYFYGLDQEKKDRLILEQSNLYKGINSDLINSIFDLLYQKKLNGKIKTTLRTHSELKSLETILDSEKGEYELRFHQQEVDKSYLHRTDSLIMATGYKHNKPLFLEDLDPDINWDEKNRYAVARNYSINNAQDIFVQNAELHTHGFVTPDLGMACYRNSVIIKELMGREYYFIEKNIAFQQFGVKAEEEVINLMDPTQHCRL